MTFLMIYSVFCISVSTTADYKVFVTNNRYEADLWVWEGRTRFECSEKEEYWIESTSRYQSDFTLRYVRSKYQADLVVFFVKNKSQAGWRKNHHLKGRLLK